ncbi:MAG: 3-oxoacyl-ACP synthase [Bacteroidota bacterium]
MLITRWTHIINNKVFCDGKYVFEAQQPLVFTEFIKLAFKSLNTAYPKFYKMDTLSKLAFVGAEVLLHDREIAQKYKPELISLVFQNAASTIDTDRSHQATIDHREQYFPSPALFVYTLPNIMLGEICIRNKFYGENQLFISKQFDAELLYNQVNLLFTKNKAEVCIAGWADIENETYESCMMLIEPETMLENSKEFRTFAPSNIKKLFSK